MPTTYAQLEKDYHRVAQERDRLRAANGKLLEAAKLGLEIAKQTIHEVGGCEHDVNVCVCSLIQEAEIIETAIKNADGRLCG